MNCKSCNTPVRDGQNGSVSKAPWSEVPEVLCYACENRMIDECDLQVVAFWNICRLQFAKSSRVGRRF